MTAIRKYSLNLVSKDSAVVLSKLQAKAGVIGAWHKGHDDLTSSPPSSDSSSAVSLEFPPLRAGN